MSEDRKRRWLRFTLRTLFVVVAVAVCWSGYQLNWMRQRQQAREWLAVQENSWYAPSLQGARVQTSAPWGLGLFGEQGVVGIGMDVEEFAGPAPYSHMQLQRLFPEARVDFSRGGNWVAANSTSATPP